MDQTSKNRTVTIDVEKDSAELMIGVYSLISQGELDIEIVDPKGKKLGNRDSRNQPKTRTKTDGTKQKQKMLKMNMEKCRITFCTTMVTERRFSGRS